VVPDGRADDHHRFSARRATGSLGDGGARNGRAKGGNGRAGGGRAVVLEGLEGPNGSRGRRPDWEARAGER
jgi:hypothetical protein